MSTRDNTPSTASRNSCLGTWPRRSPKTQVAQHSQLQCLKTSWEPPLPGKRHAGAATPSMSPSSGAPPQTVTITDSTSTAIICSNTIDYIAINGATTCPTAVQEESQRSRDILRLGRRIEPSKYLVFRSPKQVPLFPRVAVEGTIPNQYASRVTGVLELISACLSRT